MYVATDHRDSFCHETVIRLNSDRCILRVSLPSTALQ